MLRITEFERNRESILKAYVQIGILELRLRSCLPQTLVHPENLDEKWFSGVKLNEKGFTSLRRSIQLNPNSPEDVLPLSFWRYLLSNKNYGALWLPHLHKAFRKLDAPKSRSTFKEIDKAMDTALRFRNNVAHYNLDSLKTINYSLTKVNKLIELLSEPTN